MSFSILTAAVHLKFPDVEKPYAWLEIEVTVAATRDNGFVATISTRSRKSVWKWRDEGMVRLHKGEGGPVFQRWSLNRDAGWLKEPVELLLRRYLGYG